MVLWVVCLHACDAAANGQAQPDRLSGDLIASVDRPSVNAPSADGPSTDAPSAAAGAQAVPSTSTATDAHSESSGTVTGAQGHISAGDGGTPDQSLAKISQIDRKVLLECLKLASFSIHFHAETNHTGFWRSWIYPVEQETGTALSFSNTLTDLSQRARGLDKPDLISKLSLKRGLACAVTGQSITGTSSVIELAHNGYVALQARRQGFSPAKAEAFVTQSLHSIDSLLDQRDALVRADSTAANKNVVALQGKLLRHIRNQLLLLFKQWSIRSRQTEWSENTFFAIDSLQAFTQLSSSLLSLKGFTNSRLGGPAAITVLIANTMVAANPFIRTQVGRYMAKYQSRRLAKLFPQPRVRTMAELEKDWEELDQIMSTAAKSNSADINEVSFLAARTQEAERSLEHEQKRIDELRRVADQQAIAGPIIGLFSIARSTCAIVSYYGYRTDKVAANRISFAGRVSQSLGQTYSLVATPVAKIRYVIYTRKLAKEGRLPTQVYQKRLKYLADLEKQIKADHPL